MVANCSYLKARFGLAQGFAWYDDRCGRPIPPAFAPTGLLAPVAEALAAIGRGLEPTRFESLWYRRAEEVSAEALALLDAVGPAQRPFFRFLNYADPHFPYVPPPPYDHRFPGRLGPGVRLAAPAIMEALRSGKRAIPPGSGRT